VLDSRIGRDIIYASSFGILLVELVTRKEVASLVGQVLKMTEPRIETAHVTKEKSFI
jgi:phage baseplate assembly protein W